MDMQLCIVCGKYSVDGYTHKICKSKFPPIQSYSSFEYNGIAKDIILKAKGSQNAYQLLITLSKIASKEKLFPDVRAIQNELILCPIPMTSKFPEIRFKNHAEVIAKTFSDIYKIRCQNIFSKKIGIPQKTLSKEKRESTLIQFQIDPNYIGKIQNHSIMLIDDVNTTGSTLFQATKVLINLGVKSVYCYTICKDLMYN